MELKDFFEKVGGNYDEVIGRLRKDSLITKYLGLFGSDDSFANLKAAIASKDWQAGFAASHTLKGLAANLGLENLRAAASDICENLRHGEPDGTVDSQLESVEAAYEEASCAISELD